MPHEAVRPARDERRVGQGDDARRPVAAEARDRPIAQPLERCIESDPAPDRRHVFVGEIIDREQPGEMQEHDQRIMTAADLLCAGAEQAAGIAMGVDQLGNPLERDETDDDERPIHASMSWNPAVKPGPSAVISMRPRAPDWSTRFSTKSTVAADMLP